MTKKVKKSPKESPRLPRGQVTKKSLPKAETEKVSPVKKIKIRVVGIGGGGGNIVSELAQRVKKATFLAANTDLQALKEVSRKVGRFPFGQRWTSGLGTGMNPEIAETAGQNEKERIKKILQGQDLVIFIACLGGGTGSGATPIFAKISQSLGNLSYGIFTLPFKFEGERKMEIAKKALEILRLKLNTITILPNERIFQVIDKTTPLKEAFSAINKSLAQSLEGLIETIYQPGLINIDFADLRTILEGRGRLAYLNTLSFPRLAETSSHFPPGLASPGSAKEVTAKEIAEKALASPLYPYGIKGAKGVLFNIVGEKGLSLEEVSQISKTISEKTHREAKIIFGISPGRKYQNIIKTTIFATGCPTKIFFSEAPPKENLWFPTGQAKKSRRRKIKRPVEKPAEKKADVEVRSSSKGRGGFAELRSSHSRRGEKKANPSANALRSARADEDEVFSHLPQKVRKVKSKKPEKKLPPSQEVEVKKDYNPPSPPFPSGGGQASHPQEKLRKNALQIKKEIEEEEKEMLEKEKFWEAPAFLRKLQPTRPKKV